MGGTKAAVMVLAAPHKPGTWDLSDVPEGHYVYEYSEHAITMDREDFDWSHEYPDGKMKDRCIAYVDGDEVGFYRQYTYCGEWRTDPESGASFPVALIPDALKLLGLS